MSEKEVKTVADLIKVIEESDEGIGEDGKGENKDKEDK